jgi:2-methylcitrate dehydratase PrpD
MAEAAARRLARFVVGLRLADVPAAVVDRATDLVLDTLGGAVAASTMDFGRAVTATARRLAGPAEATIIGDGARVGPAAAVLANATLAHGLDFDDTREDAIVHTGCVAVPSALAVGEAVGASGAGVLEATIAGVETMCRLGLAVPGAFHARHLHPTALTGAFAAAAVTGRLLGLEERELVNAFGIAGSQSSGVIEYLADGSWTKRLHAGWAAHAGVVAALLAGAGFTGPETVIEGQHGFYAAFAGGHDPARLAGLLDSLGSTWELTALTLKPYPCGSIAQPYMDCARQLRETEGLDPGQVVEVRCRTAPGPVPRLWEPLAAKRRPVNGYAAKFSLPYLVALVLARGDAGLADFADDAVADPAVLALAARVGYDVDPTIDYPRQFVGHVTVRLADGRLLTASRDRPRGGPDAPLSAAELEGKFRGNARLRLPGDRVEALLTSVKRLRHEPGLERLVAAIA